MGAVRTSAAGAAKKLLQIIEPWYDWGTIRTWRMDGQCERECTEGEVYRFQLQWLGLHLGFQIGRTPKRAAPLRPVGRYVQLARASGMVPA